MNLPLRAPSPLPSLSFGNSTSLFPLRLPRPQPHHTKPSISILISLKPSRNPLRNPQCPSENIDIDMVKTREGFYAPKQSKVVVLWDLDNKPPRGPPYEAALSLKRVAERFGEVVDISAYANRHAFSHLPSWVAEERRERRRSDVLERKGVVIPSEPYVCSVCGRKCKTNLDLKKHFRQLHERERQKKLSRMKQLKGKKRQRFKERYLDKNYKYEEAARNLITPKVGYGLAKELRRAGIFVKTVEDKPQAADWALKKRMLHSMSSGVDWLFLVSDDSDFREMLRKARKGNLGTVVIGDRDRALGRHADLWVPWISVENGVVTDKDLLPKRREAGWKDEDDGVFSVLMGVWKGGTDLNRVIDKLVLPNGHIEAHGVLAKVYEVGF
ncbi:LOW QUALITY PROTEIN: hypothetical protein Cgig2_021407 [Carnegiea gigantea]|uniref:C2H2-type domain-containing protein n=1 Tax=Carnegiea gigantea TaxID=171969 RepID=A0A9Q1GV26_9CARY|nr:LOW QUALITY PROTEIN: hypothetical protein Cgig2_021407 [Carnegiea gigantea]